MSYTQLVAAFQSDKDEVRRQIVAIQIAEIARFVSGDQMGPADTAAAGVLSQHYPELDRRYL